MTDKNEIVAMNLRIPRSKREEIKVAADAKGQKIVTYVMNAVDVALDIDENMDLPVGISRSDLAAIAEQVAGFLEERRQEEEFPTGLDT